MRYINRRFTYLLTVCLVQSNGSLLALGLLASVTCRLTALRTGSTLDSTLIFSMGVSLCYMGYSSLEMLTLNSKFKNYVNILKIVLNF